MENGIEEEIKQKQKQIFEQFRKACKQSGRKIIGTEKGMIGEGRTDTIELEQQTASSTIHYKSDQTKLHLTANSIHFKNRKIFINTPIPGDLAIIKEN